jgi:hypothetical protein
VTAVAKKLTRDNLRSDITEDFIDSHVESLLGLYRIVGIEDEFDLLRKTLTRIVRHPDFSQSWLSSTLFFRLAIEELHRKHRLAFRQAYIDVADYLQQIGFASEDVSRILGSPVVSSEHARRMSPQKIHQVPPSDEAKNVVHTFYKSTRSRRKLQHRFLLFVLVPLLLLGGVSSVPSLRRATRLELVVTSIEQWQAHRENPYVDWLPFAPMLPSDSSFGKWNVTVIRQSSSNSPQLYAVSSAGVTVKIMQTKNVNQPIDEWTKKTIDKKQLLFDPEGDSVAENIGDVTYIFMRTSGALSDADIEKLTTSLQPYRQPPNLISYSDQYPVSAQSMLHFPEMKLNLPSQYQLTNTHVFQVDYPSSGITVQGIEWDYSDTKGNGWIGIIQTNRADDLLKQMKLSNWKVANQGPDQVFDSGQECALVVPGQTQVILVSGPNTVPMLVGFANRYIPHT